MDTNTSPHIDNPAGARPVTGTGSLVQWLAEPRLSKAWENLMGQIAHWCSDPAGQSANMALESTFQAFARGLANQSEYASIVRRAAHTEPSPTAPRTWQPLLESPSVRVGVLTLYRDYPMPMHDHPGAHTLSLVVSGLARVQQFDVVEAFEADSLCRLAEVSELTLSVGELSTTRPRRGNVHAIAPLTPSCTLLNIVTPPYAESERHWYFEFGPGLEGEPTFLADRVRIPVSGEDGAVGPRPN